MVSNGNIFLISSIRLTIKRHKGKKSKEKYAITLKIFAYAQTPETLRFFQPETEVNNGQRPGAKRHRLHRFTLFPENNRKRSNKNAANNNEKSWNPNKKKTHSQRNKSRQKGRSAPPLMMKNRKWMLVFGLPIHCCWPGERNFKKNGQKSQMKMLKTIKGKRFPRWIKADCTGGGYWKLYDD